VEQFKAEAIQALHDSALYMMTNNSIDKTLTLPISGSKFRTAALQRQA
jgi:hypothetical protein